HIELLSDLRFPDAITLRDPDVQLDRNRLRALQAALHTATKDGETLQEHPWRFLERTGLGGPDATRVASVAARWGDRLDQLHAALWAGPWAGAAGAFGSRRYRRCSTRSTHWRSSPRRTLRTCRRCAIPTRPRPRASCAASSRGAAM